MSIEGQKIIWTGIETGPVASMKTAIARKSVSYTPFIVEKNVGVTHINSVPE